MDWSDAMTYELRVTDTFDSAHFLPGHEKCGKMHGHTYRIELFITGKRLLEDVGENKSCMLIDFKRLKEVMASLITKFDHQVLNEVFDDVPTAENLARYCYYYLKKVIETKYHMKEIQVARVRIWEGLNSYCDFYETNT